MTIDRGLLRMMRAWWTTPPPVERFRTGNRRSPAHALECEIDHLASYTGTFSAAVRDGRPGDARERAADLLAEIARIEPLVDAVPAADQPRYRAWIELTRSLLLALSEQGA